jgi:SAM-dependent methyltransferase
MRDGWIDSAQAWIDAQGDRGDWTRTHVLDDPMLARVTDGGYRRALDVGCGEGRFCRLLAARGLTTTGIDPTEYLIREARLRDPAGDYRVAGAEALPFPDESFDLVVSYLSLIDIARLDEAIAEMVRVLAPGGALLIANLTSFSTAAVPPGAGWQHDESGRRLHFAMDHYLDARAERVAWSGIDIVNHHRPLSAYMQLLLAQGLRLSHFCEPRATGGDPARTDSYNRVPYALIMEWRKD